MPTTALILVDAIAKQILLVRGQRVILDSALAELYRVSTKVFNQAVKRNQERFDEDFMFQLTPTEYDVLRSQTVTSSLHGGRRYLPYVFTEHGAYMAGNVLSSKRAVEVSKFIVRAFIQMRDLLATHKNIARQLSDIEKRVGGHDEKIAQIINTIHRLLEPPPEPKKRRMGFACPMRRIDSLVSGYSRGNPHVRGVPALLPRHKNST